MAGAIPKGRMTEDGVLDPKYNLEEMSTKLEKIRLSIWGNLCPCLTLIWSGYWSA